MKTAYRKYRHCPETQSAVRRTAHKFRVTSLPYFLACFYRPGTKNYTVFLTGKKPDLSEIYLNFLFCDCDDYYHLPIVILWVIPPCTGRCLLTLPWRWRQHDLWHCIVSCLTMLPILPIIYRIVDDHLPGYTVSWSRGSLTEFSPSWKPQTSTAVTLLYF
jgi:hypothetical protein